MIIGNQKDWIHSRKLSVKHKVVASYPALRSYFTASRLRSFLSSCLDLLRQQRKEVFGHLTFLKYHLPHYTSIDNIETTLPYLHHADQDRV